MQKKVKKSFHSINAPETSSQLYQSYLASVESGEAPGVLIRMAKDLDYSPAMLSKMNIEQYLNHSGPHYTGIIKKGIMTTV